MGDINCATCANRKRVEPVPYSVHESDMARAERSNKRLWVIVIILIFALILSNAAWVYYESQFEDVVTTTQEVQQDTRSGGSNNFVGGDYYGTADGENNYD